MSTDADQEGHDSLEHARSRFADAAPTDRVTYREFGDTLAAIDELVERDEYPSRSAAIRAATHRLVADELRGETDGE